MKPDPENPLHRNYLKIKHERVGNTHTPRVRPQLENTHHSNDLNNRCCMDLKARWIAECAYFLAEARGFIPGLELDDWLEAEQEYIKVKVKEYLLISREDGGLTMTGLQKLARTIGIPNPEKADSALQLIRLIQNACKTEPCFQSKQEESCRDHSTCQWREECRKLIAEYLR